MLNHFTYLLEIPYWLLQNSNVGNKYPFAKKFELVNEINQIGSRHSGKTLSNLEMFAELIKISMLIKEPIFIFASMKMNKDIRDSIFQNIWNTLEKHNIPFSVNLSTHSFTIPNGTKIVCRGLHSATKREKLKAFADLNKYKLVIDWREECDQYNQNDINEIDFALRGSQNKITINTCNPESLKRYIVGYCNQLLPFNEEIMRSKWEQTAYIEKWDMKIIIHYTNWRLNSFLPKEEENKILRLEQLDPERARVWSWGLPGNTSGSIFARYLDIMQATDIIQPTKLLGGVDLANSTSPKGHTTAASFWLYNSFDKKAYKVAEYTHSNATQQFKGPLEQVKDILEFYNNQLNQYFNLIQQGISINVDDSAYATLESLNREKYNYTFGQYMHFKPAQKQKFKIKHRIEAFTMLINTNQLKWLWEKCPVSKNQYELIQWEDKPEAREDKVLDLYDDTFDSDFYALHFELIPMVKHNSIWTLYLSFNAGWCLISNKKC
ncbi:PBSX family phage terminase large subunit [Spiroplasma citri]|uniref:PBSX family phage terminase large subunit n=2 Tax=Spiroplasma citri TaxID=2133 RepID=A0AAJ4JY68_SPICI|nr:PBSX family phage terminase large subunit [Spiroplasma citri]APE74755.1 putative adhesin P58 [Spiroplasma citri]APE75848.1 putative adhesin P58 [Spiroplasma citri]QIA66999.1 PBSX family phage terminase large subunit [Spiroplasma citri]QIA68820.1 PBSX family phage terminase large subunit [Spiroplasma citri]QIA70685.1 PBSX family phage terminase large subunit [Spiroplasma citri]